jgi:phosphatidylserine/phosphatidylglycerophosphate/cardiolipin synthase-like enzyme
MTSPTAPLALHLHLFTPHGVPICNAVVELTGSPGTQVAREQEPGVYLLEQIEDGDYLLRCGRYGRPDGFDHRTLRQSVFARRTPEGWRVNTVDPAPGTTSRVCSCTSCPDGSMIVIVVLDYLWFTEIGAAPTLGNQVDLLVDGEEAWAAVAKAIGDAAETVHVTTWLYEPKAELLRPDAALSDAQRADNTVHNLLAARARAGATVRLLLWDAPLLPPAHAARAAGQEADDGFEVMQEANLTRVSLLDAEAAPLLSRLVGAWQIGSFHQKTVVVDGTVGFCGGMNLKHNDWDGRRHRIFEARRAAFDRDRSFRERVRDAIQPPDHPPRHDFMARVQGPAVADLEANFGERWDRLIDTGAQWSENASHVPAITRAAPVGGQQVQVVRTMPAPHEERGILDCHLRAIRSARRLIYIEDQFFRSSLIADALADTLRRWPSLALIVVTVQSYADDPVSGGWSREGFDRIAARLPGFSLHALKVWGQDHNGDDRLEEIDNHAKLLIVDDQFLSVGSCNMNDRGYQYEGEINLAVVDPVWVAAQRLDIWREHLHEDPRLGQGIESDVAIWREHADRNRIWQPGAGQPHSHVFPFVPISSPPAWLSPQVW